MAPNRLASLIGEEEDTLVRNAKLLCRLLDRGQEVRLGDDKFGLGDFECMVQFKRRVTWICANEAAASAYDSLDQDRIVEVIESVEADTIAFLEAGGAETCY